MEEEHLEKRAVGEIKWKVNMQSKPFIQYNINNIYCKKSLLFENNPGGKRYTEDLALTALFSRS